tara:strand:+ start:16123 stop:16326 length:204 start_codon:yes stop_codon:yes gene_type:complete
MWQRWSFNAVEDCGEQLPCDSHFGKLECHVLGVSRHFGADLVSEITLDCSDTSTTALARVFWFAMNP